MDPRAHFSFAWDLWLKNIAPLAIMTLLMFVVATVTLGILAPVLIGGYVHSILRLTREGRPPKMGDLFGQMRLFLPLLVFGLALFVVAAIAFSLFFLPGVVLGMVMTYFLMYMIPLMVDRGLPLVEAVKGSVAMVTGQGMVDQIVVGIIFIGLTAIGNSIPLAALFAQPLATVFLMSVYDERVKEVDL